MSLVHVLAVITAKPGKRAEVLENFNNNVPAVHAEEGCIEYGAVIDSPEASSFSAPFGPDTFVVVEKWESLDHLKAHAAAPHMKAYAEKNKDLLVLNDFNSQIKKTKEMSLILKKFEITDSLIILDKSSREKVEKSMRNIPNIKVTDINHFSAFDMIKFKKIVFTESSVKELEKRYA